MAIYATVEQIKSLGFQTDAPASIDTTVWELLADAASREFDSLCEVRENFFQAAEYDDSEPTPLPVYTNRTFFGNGTTILKLEPFIELNPSAPVTAEDDFAYDIPAYIISGDSLLWPRSPIGQWTADFVFTVSAQWGFLMIPADITLAVIKLALNAWRLSDPVNAEQTESNLEAVIDGLPASVWPIVEKYRQKYSQRAIFA